MAGGLLLAQFGGNVPTAHADPVATNALIGVGSDTWQDLGNAFSGAEPTPGAQPGGLSVASKSYTPLSSRATGAALGSLQVESFDAIDPHTAPTPGTGTSITTTLGGPSFDRPNGSGEGRTALLDSDINTANLWVSTSAPGGSGMKSVANQIQWARSSSIGGTVTSGNSSLSYIPIAGDGVSYAYHCGSASAPADCALLAHLSTATLSALYNNANNGTLAPAAWGAASDTLKACAIQTGSGTAGFFGSRLSPTQTASSMKTNVTAQNCLDLEENNVNGFVTSSTTADSTSDWVVPVSVGSEIGQHNKVAVDRSGTGLGTATTGIGTIDGAAGSFPYTGNGTATWSPDTTYFGGSFGRMIFAVVPTKRLSGVNRNQALIDLFLNTTPAFNDGVTTNGSTTISSAKALFDATDVGQTITGAGIPAGTTITAVSPAPVSTATLSNAATATATGVSITVNHPARVCSSSNTATSALFGFAQTFTNASQGTGTCGAVFTIRTA